MKILWDFKNLTVPIFILILYLVYETDGSSLNRKATKEVKEATSGRSLSSNGSEVYSSPLVHKGRSKTKAGRSKVNKGQVHILNVDPETVSAYEIPISITERDKAKKDEKKKRKSSKDKNSSTLSRLGDSSTWSVLNPRTLMMAPLLAIPVVFAEAMTLGGVGIAIPGLLFLLPLVIAPLIVISFIMYI